LPRHHLKESLQESLAHRHPYPKFNTKWRFSMTTTVSISPQLLDAVLKLTQATTKHQAVEIALKIFI